MQKEMDTVNMILMMVLCAMIGFAIGNVCGKESMKRIFSTLLDQMLKGIQSAGGKTGDTKGE